MENEKPTNNNDLAHFETYISEISEKLKILTNSSAINLNDTPINSHRKLLGPTITFFKKVVRKLLGWYTEPVAIQQTKFNEAITPSIGKITEISNHLLNKIDEVTISVEQLEVLRLEEKQATNTTFDHINRQNSDLTERINQIENNHNKWLQDLEMQQKFISDHFNYIDSRFKLLDKLEILQEHDGSFFHSYAQSGEDGILDYVIRALGIPFKEVSYVDLGANDPINLNNTYSLYCKGARGVLVEANPNLIPKLKFFRNQDIILNNCVDEISDERRKLFIMNSDGLSTVDYKVAEDACEINPNLKVTEEIIVTTVSFNDIVDRYLGAPPTILSIDLEGMDVKVIKSIDFSRFRPFLIVVETIEYDTKLAYGTKNEDISNLMQSLNYDEYAFTGINSIFIDKERLNQFY